MITQEQLKHRLHYDPGTGVFTWLNGKRKGKTAGSKDGQGYLEITVDGNRKQRYKAHRLIWLYVHGQWPAAEIDHINPQSVG